MPELNRALWRRCRAPLPLAALSLALLHAQGAAAQGAPVDAPLILKRTPELTESIPPELRGQLPSFVDGNRISGSIPPPRPRLRHKFKRPPIGVPAPVQPPCQRA